jgi:hypothetical protein
MVNLTWHEVWTGVESSYARVAAWFPVLESIKKKSNYSEENTLTLAVQAAV